MNEDERDEDRSIAEARRLAGLSPDAAADQMDGLKRKEAGALLLRMDPHFASEVLKQMPRKKAARALATLAPDVAANIITPHFAPKVGPDIQH